VSIVVDTTIIIKFRICTLKIDRAGNLKKSRPAGIFGDSRALPVSEFFANELQALIEK
jgi:hypothetical protein